MRDLVQATARPWVVVATAMVATALSRAGAQVPVPPGIARPLVSVAEYNRWKTELSNWGRWGKDDQAGALNLITPAKRREAAALVKDGDDRLAGD